MSEKVISTDSARTLFFWIIYLIGSSLQTEENEIIPKK